MAPGDATDSAAAEPPASAPAEAADDAGPQPPSIDVFRLEKDGRMVIAGTAVPGRETAILLDGRKLGTVVAGDDGNFVQFLDVPPSDKARVLSLRTLASNGESGIDSR